MRWIALVALASCTKDPEPPPRPVPVVPIDGSVIIDEPPVPRTPVVALALGDEHSCALHEDGLVSCWGSSYYGELGDGATVERQTPVRARVEGVVELAAQGQSTCARKRDRSVWCWGSKAQLLVPTRMGIDDATQISGACAVRAGGGIACWTDGRVEAIAGIAGAVAVASANRYQPGDDACAALASGKVACWTKAGEVHEIAGIDDAVAVAVGSDFACARRRGGGIACWGHNGQAQLGRGTVDNRVTMRGPTPLPAGPVAGLAGTTQLAAGSMFACALDRARRVTCWGQRLGREMFAVNDRPVDTGVRATAIAAGGGHACAIAGGVVTCWGRNTHGQLGNGWSAIRREPTRVPGIDDAVAVVAHHELTCARRKTGTVACWGRGDPTPHDLLGVTGVEQLAGGFEPCVRDRAGAVTCLRGGRPTKIALPRPAIDVAANTTFGCALLADHTVSCWGDNQYGMFGNGATTAGDSDLPPSPAAAGLADAIAIATGPFHGCAIRANREVACWGNRHDTTTLGRSALVPEPIAGIADAKQLALGTAFSCVLRATGKVVCWGGSERGELGHGTATISMVPTEVRGIADAVQIAGHGETTCVRRTAGTLACWGRNAEGQLGDGAVRDPADPARGGRSTPVAVPGITNAVDVSTSGFHTCAVLADGGVTCWGTADQGQCGTVTSYAAKPAPVVWR